MRARASRRLTTRHACQVLDMLEFSSARRRMSVVVREEGSKTIELLTKARARAPCMPNEEGGPS